MKHFLFLLALNFIFMGLAKAEYPLSAPRSVRVAILKDTENFVLSIRGRFQIVDSRSFEVLDQPRSLTDAQVTADPNGITIGKNKYAACQITILPRRDGNVFVNKRRFRGDINLTRGTNNRMLVVNSIGLEEYVKGVLYHEVSHRWPLEALKAQAVAARTYALYRMQQTAALDYDVTNDIYSQVYGGRSSERYRCSVAVDRTKGQVLIYGAKILPAYFHATCGGTTEDASELWKENLHPLKGVVCDYCRLSPHYRWKRNFRSSDVQDKLSEQGINVGVIEDIGVVDSNRSGRIKTLQITSRDGQKTLIPGKDFRTILGPNVVKSNSYEVVMQGYYFDLLGKGWGHGVGLCQWGANFMARAHYRYEQILGYYYPGAAIVNYREVIGGL